MNIVSEEEGEEESIILEIEAEVNPTATQEMTAVDDEDVEENQDISIRRIKQLKSTLRKLLFKTVTRKARRTVNGETIEEAVRHEYEERDLKLQLPDITDEELRSCLVICNILKRYIPNKPKIYSVGHTLHFFLMSNDLLNCTRYDKFTQRLCPITKLNSLHALKLDAPSIFVLFCTSKTRNNMNLFTFDDNVIMSRDMATGQKDAVFASFFDLDKIKKLCSSYGLELAHNMYVLPSAKTLRISGYLKQPFRQPQREYAATPYIKVLHKSLPYQKKSVDTKHELKQSAMLMQAEMKGLNRQIKMLYRRRKENLIQLSGLKQELASKKGNSSLSTDGEAHNRILYPQIKNLKRIQKELELEISNIKQALADTRQNLFIRQKIYKMVEVLRKIMKKKKRKYLYMK
ncbi:MAG: hypothetical protein EXX96DRAFT_610407 [Benjaminiella poitrasii]|nr:MAG: hypothetical protein EXX96DRAFT_610407 [Benjaminiella poitrasii]